MKINAWGIFWVIPSALYSIRYLDVWFRLP